MRPHFITLLIIISLCGACSKKSTPAKIDGNLLNNFAFKEGSYWIYRDSLTGIYDSFVVTSANVNEHTDQSGGRYYSFDHVIIGSDTNGVYMNFSLEGNSILFTYGEHGWESLTNGAQYPFSSNSLLKVHSSYTVAGNTYDTVAELLDEDSRNNDHFFLRRGIGFVKLHIDHSLHENVSNLIELKRVWELQRYHVIPNN